MTHSTATRYESDFCGWIDDQAQLLRSGKFTQLDIDNLVEEIEAMGRSEKRSLESHLAVLLMHLLKWQYQPDYRGRSWMLTIQEQRIQVRNLVRDSPSLKHTLAQHINRAWEQARIKAERETKIHQSLFPPQCIWAFEQILDDAFWPEGASRLDTGTPENTDSPNH